VLAQKGAWMSGIDSAPTFIRHARKAEQHITLNVGFYLADCKDLPFAQAPFDFVDAFMLLMDVNNPD
jgi:2-polyprenyl-3-methyl-5-hydroxy-6-metoxy-1,4-benzoquinol methylase